MSMFGEEGNGELKLWFGAVPLGHSRLKIWGCHSCGTGFSFGVSLIPGLGITTCCGCSNFFFLSGQKNPFGFGHGNFEISVRCPSGNAN